MRADTEPLVFLVQTQLFCSVWSVYSKKYFIFTSNLLFYKTNFDVDVLSISIFNMLGTKLDPTDLICGELLCEKTFNGQFGVKQHLIQGDPVSDGSPPWCPSLIEALSVSVNCWSLVRVHLMTLSFAGSTTIINLMPLKTAHYGMHLICCQVSCADGGWCVTSVSVM